MFHDLNIDVTLHGQKGSNPENFAKAAYEAGFGVIALNQTIAITGNVKAQNQMDLITTKNWTNPSDAVMLKRLTLAIKDPKDMNLIFNNDSVIKNWDLIAVRPANEQVFVKCAQLPNVDIISLDARNRSSSFKIKHAIVKQATKKGINFEIVFNDFIQDATTRQFALSSARRVVEITGGKNVIVTSGSQKELDLRGPYDLINFGLLFGMEASICKMALTSNCHSLVLYAQTRKTHRGMLQINNVSDLSEQDRWMIPDTGTENQASSSSTKIRSKFSNAQTHSKPRKKRQSETIHDEKCVKHKLSL